jgi:hypothetical protein
MDVTALLISAAVVVIAIAAGPFLAADYERKRRECREMNRKRCDYCGMKSGEYSEHCHFCNAPLPMTQIHWEVR